MTLKFDCIFPCREEETEFIVEYDDEEPSIHNMSVEDLNLTISESEAAMQGLQKQEQSLMEQSKFLLFRV